MSSETYLFLSLAEPSGDDARRLNSVGRWAVKGTAQTPLLAWPSAQADAAEAAAARASEARGCKVDVVSGAEVPHLRLFTDASEPALGAATPHSEAKARRLRTEAEKLEAFCLVVQAASSATDQAAFAEVSRAASKALRARFGGGTITSAFAWLAGPAGHAALESVLTGEAEPGGTLSLPALVAATRMAQQAEALREQDEGPGRLH